MKTKELIKSLESLDPNLEVYITNTEETQLTQIDVVIQCEDYGENSDDNEEFVAIFPKTNPESLFSLTREELEVIKASLSSSKYMLEKAEWSIERDIAVDDIDSILTRIKQWKDEQAKCNTPID